MTAPPEKAPFDWSKVITPEAIAYAKISRERERLAQLDLRDSAVVRCAEGSFLLLGPRGAAEARFIAQGILGGSR